MIHKSIPRKARSRWANPWTAEQKHLLEHLALDNTPWPDIATRLGHPKTSCQSTLSSIRRNRKRAQGIHKPRAVPAHESRQTPTFDDTKPTRRLPEIEHADAELRARIAALGPNGLLGDPLPGRSALDQKRHGVSP